jgi:lipoyl(octanoyl) transferase
MTARKPLWVIKVGRIAYGPAFELQREVVAARKSNAVPDALLFCEHPHVITLGRNGQTQNLLASENVLRQMNVEFHETDRGGDITYHGPGQIVGYPILDLAQHKRDVRWYVEQLEEVMIRTAADYGLAARRILCRHGIWIDPPAAHAEPAPGTVPDAWQDVTNISRPAPSARHNLAQPGRAGNESETSTSAVGAAQTTAQCSSAREHGDEEKLAALGVHLSRWVTSHGFAFNVSTDLRYFDLIIPCGIKDKRATSLDRALGRPVPLDEARARLAAHFTEIFHADAHDVSLNDLRAALE